MAGVLKQFARYINCGFCGRTVVLSRLGLRSISSQEERKTHFGYEMVTEEEKTEKVYQVFENVASSYDTMNDVMSLGIHRLWKHRFIKLLNPSPGTKLLDVAGGTGDIAFKFLEHVKQKPEPHTSETLVTVCDINKSMLEVGKKRAARLRYKTGISWIAGDAEELPVKTGSVDAYTIAFGIRNITRIEKALEEAYRVLTPGGRFLCMEFSEVQNPIFASLYDRYSFEVIPVFGELVAGDWKSYQYLVESIRQFPDQDNFAGMIEDAGFSHVTYENLSCGIAAIHSGFKV